MGISEGFGLLNGVLTDTLIFNISWIISIVFVFFTLLIITRDVNKWKTLAFPVTILWHIVGITPSFLFYIVTGILFIVDALSLETIGNVLGAIVTNTKNLGTNKEKVRIRDMMRKEADKRRKKDLKALPMDELLKAIKGGKR